MKANAPEKLYIHPTANGKVGASWLTFPLTNEDIEYTRADAFIEKACEWLEPVLKKLCWILCRWRYFKRFYKLYGRRVRYDVF